MSRGMLVRVDGAPWPTADGHTEASRPLLYDEDDEIWLHGCGLDAEELDWLVVKLTRGSSKLARSEPLQRELRSLAETAKCIEEGIGSPYLRGDI